MRNEPTPGLHRVILWRAQSENQYSNEEHRNCQQREHQYRDEQDECDDCKNADPYDPHEIDKWAHCFRLSIEVSNSVLKRALTVKISAFKIHIDVFGATTRAHRPVIIHKPNGLPAVVAWRSFFHYVKAHTRSISCGYYKVSLVDQMDITFSRI